MAEQDRDDSQDEYAIDDDVDRNDVTQEDEYTITEDEYAIDDDGAENSELYEIDENDAEKARESEYVLSDDDHCMRLGDVKREKQFHSDNRMENVNHEPAISKRKHYVNFGKRKTESDIPKTSGHKTKSDPGYVNTDRTTMNHVQRDTKSDKSKDRKKTTKTSKSVYQNTGDVKTKAQRDKKSKKQLHSYINVKDGDSHTDKPKTMPPSKHEKIYVNWNAKEEQKPEDGEGEEYEISDTGTPKLPEKSKSLHVPQRPQKESMYIDMRGSQDLQDRSPMPTPSTQSPTPPPRTTSSPAYADVEDGPQRPIRPGMMDYREEEEARKAAAKSGDIKLELPTKVPRSQSQNDETWYNRVWEWTKRNFNPLGDLKAKRNLGIVAFIVVLFITIVVLATQI